MTMQNPHHHAINGKTHELPMVIFNSYVGHDQRVNPIKSHETTVFPWFSYGFPLVFLGYSWHGQDGERQRRIEGAARARYLSCRACRACQRAQAKSRQTNP